MLFTIFLDISRILLFADFTIKLLEVVVESSAYCLLANFGLIPFLEAFKVDCAA